MSFEVWLAYAIATTILLIIPGPTILTVISYAVSHGRRTILPLVAAVALGDATALVLSLIGLGALLATSALWFSVVKWAGGLYLIYLGIKLLRSRTDIPVNDPRTQTPVEHLPESRWKLFFNTWLVTALNPKGMVFFVAFLPQFVNPSSAVVPQLWVLSVTFVVLAALNALAFALCANSARRMLESPASRRRFNLAGGTLLSAAGCWALTVKQSV